jgi:hypothetical protein
LPPALVTNGWVIALPGDDATFNPQPFPETALATE